MLFHTMGIDNYSQVYEIDEYLGIEMLNEGLPYVTCFIISSVNHVHLLKIQLHIQRYVTDYRVYVYINTFKYLQIISISLI